MSTSRRTTLVAAREASNLTQEGLASAAGLSRISVARYEAGAHEPGLTAAFALAHTLGLPVERLFAAESRAARKRAA